MIFYYNLCEDIGDNMRITVVQNGKISVVQ